MKTTHIKVASKEKAWEEANKLFTTDYEKDEHASIRAGYDIYRHSKLNYNHYICDLETRLEVNIDNTTINIWIEEEFEEVKTEILGVDCYQVAENTFEIRLVNGQIITVKKDVEYNGNIFEYKVGSQYFDKFGSAYKYVRELVTEKVTGNRIIYHTKRNPPEICGHEGKACRNPQKCNTMLCTNCPIAEQFFADRDNVKLVYAISQ